MTNADKQELINDLTERVLGAVFEVSNTLGCGFLEKIYEKAMIQELLLRGVRVASQVRFPVRKMHAGYNLRMADAMKSYVEFRDGGYFLTGKRISLSSIVSLYWTGASPEVIQDDYPSLSLEEIHGSLAFYLGNRAAVDKSIDQNLRQFHECVPDLERAQPALFDRLQRARRVLLRTAS